MLLSICLSLTMSAGALHDDDPKLLDRVPPYAGPSWRKAQSLGLLDSVELQPLSSAAALLIEGPDFASQGVHLQSWLTLPEFNAFRGNDCWGYVAPSGREYALLGHGKGTGVVEITDPAAATIIGNIAGPGSLWRDIKVYGQYAYAVSEGGEGIQVIDLSGVDQGVVTLVGNVLTGGPQSSHNVAIDTDSGFLYRVGGSGRGLRIYSLQNPATPTFVGEWSQRYVHDAQIVTYTSGPFANRQIAFCCSGFSNGYVQTGLTILDVTDKQNIFVRSQTYYPDPAYSHQAWLSPDRQYLYLNDELDEGPALTTRTHVIDVADIDAPVVLSPVTNGNKAIGHNLYTLPGRMLEANYRSGLRVFDTTNQAVPQEIGWFDTWPGDDEAHYNGLWSVYPYFPSGTVIGSDIEKGLFVWKLGDPDLQFTYPGGLAEVHDPAGQLFYVQVQAQGSASLQPGSAQLHVDDGGGVTLLPLVDDGSGLLSASLPPAACGTLRRLFISARSSTGALWSDPPAAPAQAHIVLIGEGEHVHFEDDFQSDLGWTVGALDDTATGGLWVRGVPPGGEGSPQGDHSPNGTQAYHTGVHDDVDGGYTTLTGPRFDLSTAREPVASAWVWFYRYDASQGGDSIRFEASDDDGQTWTLLELDNSPPVADAGVWVHRRWPLASAISLTSTVRFRVRVRDTNLNSILEAAIDDFVIREADCDCNGNDVADRLDINSGTSLDCNGNQVPDECDIQSGTSPDLDLDGVPDECGPGAQSYCLASPNSVGSGALMSSLGAPSVTQGNFSLQVSGAPAQFGLFFYGPDQAQVAFGDGLRCVGPGSLGLFRLSPAGLVPSGMPYTRLLDFTTAPVGAGPGAIQAGSTWNFQFWYRDPQGPGGTGFNLSDGLQVPFQP